MIWHNAKFALRDGQKITRSSWAEGSYWELSKDGFERIICHNGDNARVHLGQLEATDWEIFEDIETPGEFLKRLGVDGQKWAKEFIKLFKDKKEKIDEGLMIGWFCNAIISGMDEQARIIKDKLEKIL